MSAERAARRMLDLLARERAAARAADLGTLASLAAEKERLAAAIEAGPPPGEATLRRLAAALAETAPLLGASLEGVRAARARLEAQEAPFRTYGPDGSTGAMGARSAGPVRRA